MGDQGEARDAAPLPLSIVEAERIIGRLEKVIRQRHVILVGGQAVALWAVYLQDKLARVVRPAQVVSGDLDLLGMAEDARQAAELLGGRVYLSRWEDRTPLTGVAMFLDGDGHERRLDVMRSIHGMRSDDIRATAIEVDVRLDDGRRVPVWVMHPER